MESNKWRISGKKLIAWLESDDSKDDVEQPEDAVEEEEVAEDEAETPKAEEQDKEPEKSELIDYIKKTGMSEADLKTALEQMRAVKEAENITSETTSEESEEEPETKEEAKKEPVGAGSMKSSTPVVKTQGMIYRDEVEQRNWV